MKKSYFIFLGLSLGLLVLGIVFAGANILAFISFPAFVVVFFYRRLSLSAYLDYRHSSDRFEWPSKASLHRRKS